MNGVLATGAVLQAIALSDFPSWVAGVQLTDEGVPIQGLAAATLLIVCSSALTTVLLHRRLRQLRRAHGEAKGGGQRGGLAAWLLGLVGGHVILHAGCVLLGAPIVRLAWHTNLWAWATAALSVAPAPGLVGTARFSRTWTRAKGLAPPPSSLPSPPGEASRVAVMYASLSCAGVALGAWLGAICMVLDWGTAWLQWPLPVLYGAWLGHVCGCTTCVVALAIEAKPGTRSEPRAATTASTSRATPAPTSRSKPRPTPTPTPAPAPAPVLPWELVTVVVVVWRGLNALCLRTSFAPDEYYQSVDPAYLAATGLLLTPPNHSLRAWQPPLRYAIHHPHHSAETTPDTPVQRGPSRFTRLDPTPSHPIPPHSTPLPFASPRLPLPEQVAPSDDVGVGAGQLPPVCSAGSEPRAPAPRAALVRAAGPTVGSHGRARARALGPRRVRRTRVRRGGSRDGGAGAAAASPAAVYLHRDAC